MRITTFFALSTLTLFACRSDSNNNTDGGPGGDGSGSNAGTVKVKDVQNDAMAPGTQVELHGVIVTAIDKYGSKVGDFWVEDADGGAYSGVHIFGAPTGDVANLHLGDSVDISGAVKSEFALTSDTTGRTVTELEPVQGGQITITNNGPGTVPAPSVVDALMIGQLAETSPPSATSPRSMEWEKWEGVLITVMNVSATSSPKCVGSACSDMTLENFGITGDAVVESSLAAFPNDGGTPPHDLIARGDCLAGVTGVVDYFFDYLILPRETSEVMTGGTACPVENTSETCSDNMDNDGNGFTDCDDFSCVLASSSCRTDTTIAAIDQAGDANPANPTLPTGAVSISGACVTALPSGGSSMYIAAAGAANNDGGLFVFGGGTQLPSGVAVGSLVDVIGNVQAFKANNSTAPEPQVELASLQVTKVAGTCVPAAKVVTSDMSALTQDTNGHPLIGSLVTLAPSSLKTFQITTAQSGTGKFGVLTQNGTTVKFGMSIVGGNLGTANTCFSSITGIWTYDTNGAGGYEILPTVMPTAGTCNN
jgi:hypothetical protein